MGDVGIEAAYRDSELDVSRRSRSEDGVEGGARVFESLTSSVFAWLG